MPSQPYTFRIAYAEGIGKTVTYTVPDGKRVVVTNILAASGGATGTQVFVAVHGIYAYSWFAPGTYTADRAAVKMVAYERETVVLQTVGADSRVIVTGYIFEDTVGKPGIGTLDVELTPPELAPAPSAGSS